MDISVAICTFNGEGYLEAQLDSILQQERPPDELVICDDGSNDGTPDILQEYQSRHPDLVEVHFNEETKGIVRNFSECIERCSGDVVARSAVRTGLASRQA